MIHNLVLMINQITVKILHQDRHIKNSLFKFSEATFLARLYVPNFLLISVAVLIPLCPPPPGVKITRCENVAV